MLNPQMTFKKEKGRGHKCVSVGVFIENKEAWEKICVSANTGGLYNGRLSSGYICIHSSWQTSAFLGPIIIQTIHPPSYSSPKGDRQVLEPCAVLLFHVCQRLWFMMVNLWKEPYVETSVSVAVCIGSRDSTLELPNCRFIWLALHNLSGQQ